MYTYFFLTLVSNRRHANQNNQKRLKHMCGNVQAGYNLNCKGEKKSYLKTIMNLKLSYAKDVS